MTISAQQAALNNAEWCPAVWRSHGLVPEKSEGALLTWSEVPALYPNIVTIEEDYGDRLQIELIKQGLGRLDRLMIKDSFARLALEDLPFKRKFDAQWVSLNASPQYCGIAKADFFRVTNEDQFNNWIGAWIANGGGIPNVLLPSLLDDPDLSFGVCLTLMGDGKVGSPRITLTNWRV